MQNEILDNKTLRTHEEKHCFVLLAERNGNYRYVGKTYWSCHDLNLTVKINSAKKWSSKISIESFIERYCEGYNTKIKEVIIRCELVESEGLSCRKDLK